MVELQISSAPSSGRLATNFMTNIVKHGFPDYCRA